MPTATKPPQPMPPPDVQLIDPETGRLTKVGFDLLKNWRDLIDALRKEIP